MRLVPAHVVVVVVVVVVVLFLCFPTRPYHSSYTLLFTAKCWPQAKRSTTHLNATLWRKESYLFSCKFRMSQGGQARRTEFGQLFLTHFQMYYICTIQM